jgi:hypothetical protein
MKKKPVKVPKFSDEGDEADWWASPEGREFVRTRAWRARAAGEIVKGSRLVAKLNGRLTVSRCPPRSVSLVTPLAKKKASVCN